MSPAEAELRTEIRTQLGSNECKKLKNLHAILDTKESRELAMEYIYIQAATYGVSVQTAMSNYDSSLGE
jgi:hypothetical protein